MQFFGSCIEVDMHQELFVHDSDNEIKGTDKNCSRKLEFLCFESFETITNWYINLVNLHSHG